MTKLPTGRHTQQIKSDKKNKKQYLKNKALKTRAKTYIKKVGESIQAEDTKTAIDTLSSASKMIDKAAAKGAIHKKKAARLKSRLTKKVNQSKSEK